MSALQTEVLVFVDGEEILRRMLTPGKYILGSAEGCHIRVEATGISDRHTCLTVADDGSLTLEDLGSAGATFDGPTVRAPIQATPNQTIQVGAAQILLRQSLGGAAGNAVTANPTQAAPAPSAPLAPAARSEARYEVGPEIAKGGMGAVHSARQPAIRREVALKVMLRHGSPHDRLRFIEEAQITGQLEHPNIVPVHDLAVNEQDQPYYTMKMVQGRTLKDILKLLAEGDTDTLAKCPLAALLTIFQKMCDAVAFAHAKGVIHRDLKPANIMVGDYGEVLVMDWGLAKRIGRDDPPSRSDGFGKSALPSLPASVVTVRDDQSEIFATRDGAVMGTPKYMSPEQTRGEVATLDERSDVFSLGAILYEIVTLSVPFPGKTPREILANIQSGQFLLPNAYLRASGMPRPRHLSTTTIPDSLEAVIAKALVQNREQRYQHVADLQTDLTAYLGGFATSAENAGAWKQLKLFVGRHRGISVAVAASFLLIAVLTGVFTTRVVAERNRTAAERDRAELEKKSAQAARQEAVAAKKDADELISYMQYDLRDTLGKLGHLEMMKAINTRILKYHRDHLPEAGALADFREKTVGLDEQGNILEAQGKSGAALQSYRESLGIREKLAKSDPTDTGSQRDLAVSYDNVGDVLKKQGQLDDALQSYRESLGIHEKLAKSDPTNAGWQRDLSFNYEKVGEVLYDQGQRDAALQCFRDSLTIAEKLAKSDPTNAGWQRDLSFSYEKVGEVLYHQEQLSAALQSFRDALAIAEKLAKSDPTNADSQCDLAGSYHHIGQVLGDQGQFGAALQGFRDGLAIMEKLVKSDPTNAGWQCNLAVSYDDIGVMLKSQSQLDAALQSFRDGLAIAEKLAKSDPANAVSQYGLAKSYRHIGQVLRDQGRFGAALQSFRDGLTIMEKLAKSDPTNAGWQRDLSVSYDDIGVVLKNQSQLDDALQSFRDGLAITEKLAKNDPTNADWQRDTVEGYRHIGEVLHAQSQFGAALQSYRDGLAIMEKLAKNNPTNAGWQSDLAVSYFNVGEVLLRDKKPTEAKPFLDQALEIADRLSKAHPANYLAQITRSLARCQLSVCTNNTRSGRGEAVRLMREAIAILEGVAKSPGLQPLHQQWLKDYRSRLKDLESTPK